MLCSSAEALKPFISEMAETADTMEVSCGYTKSGPVKLVREGKNYLLSLGSCFVSDFR